MKLGVNKKEDVLWIALWNVYRLSFSFSSQIKFWTGLSGGMLVWSYVKQAWSPIFDEDLLFIMPNFLVSRVMFKWRVFTFEDLLFVMANIVVWSI